MLPTFSQVWASLEGFSALSLAGGVFGLPILSVWPASPVRAPLFGFRLVFVLQAEHLQDAERTMFVVLSASLVVLLVVRAPRGSCL